MGIHRNFDMLATELSLGNVNMLAEYLRNPIPDHAIIVEAMTTMSAFMRAYDPIAQHRRLHLTDKRQLGLGLQFTKVGDEIWLVDGAQVPFILRRVALKEQIVCSGQGRHMFMDL